MSAQLLACNRTATCCWCKTPTAYQERIANLGWVVNIFGDNTDAFNLLLLESPWPGWLFCVWIIVLFAQLHSCFIIYLKQILIAWGAIFILKDCICSTIQRVQYIFEWNVLLSVWSMAVCVYIHLVLNIKERCIFTYICLIKKIEIKVEIWSRIWSFVTVIAVRLIHCKVLYTW